MAIRFLYRRREFITLLGGAVAGWPFIARAQEGRQVRLVGIFYDTSRSVDPAIMSEIAAFKEALQRLGWSEGRNIRFEGPFNLPDSGTRQKLAKEMIAVPDVFIFTYRDLVISLTIRHRIPYVCGNVAFVRAGALLAYDIDRLEQAGRAASYVDRILKGERPGDLPIQGPVKFTLAINLKTAKTIGLEVPWFLQQRADEVIE
jgi:putative ABC transport system substrate-binding protein